MWEVDKLSRGFTICVIAYARGVSSPQGIRNSDTSEVENVPLSHTLQIILQFLVY